MKKEIPYIALRFGQLGEPIQPHASQSQSSNPECMSAAIVISPYVVNPSKL